MSLFSSLYTGAAGMMAQEKATAMISTNVANMSTTGFKRSEATFRDIVTTASRRAPYSSGSVGVERMLRADQAGTYQQTSSRTNASIIGNGFFAVRPTTDTTQPMFYTRNGQFETDQNGMLINSAGFIAHGWLLDSTGVSGAASLDALVPVDTSIIENTAVPTTAVDIRMNLDGAQDPYDPHLLDPAQQLPVNGQPAHFTRSVNVYDANGTERTLTLEFRKIVGPMAHFTTNVAAQLENTDVLVNNPGGKTSAITAGDTLSITDGTNTLGVSFVGGAADTSLNQANTMADVITVINNYIPAGSTSAPFTATLRNGQLLVQATDETVTLDITASAASVLGNNGFNFVQDPLPAADYTYEPDADVTADGIANPNQSDFPAFANPTNPFHWWELTVTIPDPANPTGSTLVPVRQGLVNFNADGTINMATDANGAALLDMTATPIDFDSSDATDDQGMTINLAEISQFAGQYTVIEVSQNGVPVGTANSFDIGSDGTVTANFTNGISQDIYRLPVILFTNANGLSDESGTVFSETDNSGAPIVTQAGQSGAGTIQGATIENSNVDISDEFSHMIVAQRAYGLNGKIIQAVDEMTSNLVQLSR